MLWLKDLLMFSLFGSVYPCEGNRFSMGVNYYCEMFATTVARSDVIVVVAYGVEVFPTLSCSACGVVWCGAVWGWFTKCFLVVFCRLLLKKIYLFTE